MAIVVLVAGTLVFWVIYWFIRMGGVDHFREQYARRKEEARRAALGYGDFETVMDVVANAVAKGPHLMGEQFTAADVVIGSTLRWGMMFKLLPERPEFTAYTSRLAARPAAQRAEAKDKELAAA